MGAQVHVISSEDAKLAQAKKLGATSVLNYKTTPAWEKELLVRTGKRGIDHILEVGGPGTLEKSLACVATGGQIALIGVLTGFGAPSCSLFPLVVKNATISGIYVGSRQAFEEMNRFIEAQALQPIIDRVFPFDQAAEAYDYLESARHFGKIVIKITR
jgi:NADPH:quinone reductase-like Zn-dependent oxidoreductase